jgi:dihydroorotase
MLTPKHIDPHVHCRDWEESHKATIKSVMEIAKSQNVCAIFDMPNTKPPIVSKELVKKRIDRAREQGCLDGYYLYIGITNNPEQIKEAVEAVETVPRVIGIKMFAARSVGDLSITTEKAQSLVYRELAQEHYDGVLAVHCEKESLFQMDLWDPTHPQTWNLARPPEAEVESVKDQIRFAKESRFEGVLHICHISTPKAVEVVKAETELNITCGVTPHHLSYSTEDMESSTGLIYKVNPPLRDYSTTKLLKDYLEKGKIDWIETDNAPHTQSEKIYPPHMSGIESLREYSTFLSNLSVDGVTEEQILNLTFNNIKKIFKKVIQ